MKTGSGLGLGARGLRLKTGTPHAVPARSTPQAPRRKPRAPSRAFTLIELLVVITITSMLFLSLSAALSGTLQTTAAVAELLSSWQAGASALQRMDKEMGLATQFVATNLRQVSFYVPDITGDAAADLIQYSWSGTAGAPLVRTVNGAGSTNVIPQAQDVKFSYNYRSRSSVGITNLTKDISVTPASFVDYGAYPWGLTYYDVRPSPWRGQSFTPVTDSHRTDYIAVRARTTAIFGGTNLSILLTDRSTGRTLASGTLSKYDLHYYNTRTFVVPMTWQDADGSGVTTDRDYRWVFKPSSNTYAADLEAFTITSGSGPSNGTFAEYSTNGGDSWVSLGDQADIRFVTYGTYTITYGINAAQGGSLLRRVDITLTCGTGTNVAVFNSSVRAGNIQ